MNTFWQHQYLKPRECCLPPNTDTARPPPPGGGGIGGKYQDIQRPLLREEGDGAPASSGTQ